ncbi:hypothetical protein Pflav_059320 [Phytohabitans flavus]|uniref:Uncharacterized protein n=1 Tax=Phytohabitans flavus TaxID=1076124 RepID=A0A6F8Y081_9ACTN|nr:hypothetical protein Pflav_059320 [Phytohabitans flavus]
MSELRELSGYRLDQLRMVVAEREHSRAHEEVDEDVAVDIAYEAARRVGDSDG